MTPESASSNLANSLRQLREIRGLTQRQLAALAEVPRPTLANLESGSANPTLHVLLRLAGALQVSLDELVSPPRAMARHYRAAELPTELRGQVAVRALLPDHLPGVLVERLEIPQRAGMRGSPHKPGTREYLACESGRVQLSASGQTWALEPGDVVVFRGDQKHGYRNVGAGTAVAYCVVLAGTHGAGQ